MNDLHWLSSVKESRETLVITFVMNYTILEVGEWPARVELGEGVKEDPSEHLCDELCILS